MFPKLDTLKAIIHATSSDIILGTETWLSHDICSDDLTLPSSFVIFRKDRTSSRGGGVLIAVKQAYQPSIIAVDSPLEALWISVKFGHSRCVLGVCYRPPDSRPEFTDLFNEAVELVTNRFPSCLLIIGGDFNYPAIDWSTSSVSTQINRAEHIRFVDSLHYHDLTQLVHDPTRGNHILDLLLTNNPNIAETHVLEAISDHKVVQCSFSLPHADKAQIKKCILNYARADIENMNRKLLAFSNEFQEDFENRSTSHNWCIFRDKLKEIEASCVPKSTIKTRADDPWFTREVNRCLNKKKRSYKKASRTNTTSDWQNYKSISILAEKSILEAKNQYFNITLPNLLKTNPKKFWEVVNPKSKHSIPTLLGEDGSALPAAECAEEFNKSFATVFTVELPLDSSLQLSQPHVAFPFTPIVVTAHGVSLAIERLPLKTSPGPDGISTKLLKLTSQYSAPLLSLIFQQSIDTGCVPDDWKSAFIIPIFKSGDSSLPSNYRPISLTSISCKLLEHIIHKHIITYLNENNLLLINQHGFRKNLSCQTQLFELITDLHHSLHSSLYVDAVFVDFSKAFDRVPHNRLILKIRSLKLDQKTTQWIEQFLTNRHQSVKFQNHTSNPARVISGVPQGSVLGPLLFLIYINDIATNINATIRLFADDCVIYKEIASPTDITHLQSALNKLSEWCSVWQMQINIDKTKHLKFSPALKTQVNTYAINNIPIDSVSTFKYLGIKFNSSLTWNDHIEHITSKSLKKLGLLKRRLHLATRDTRLLAYNSLIRPSLEYASIIWHPYHVTWTNHLEAVQNKAARFILSSYSRFQSVTKLKDSLKMPSLAMRRTYARLAFFHTIFHSNTSFSHSHISPAHHISSRLDHAYKVKPIFAHTEKYRNSPLALSIDQWNSLPSSIATINDPQSFLSALQSFLERQGISQ